MCFCNGDAHISNPEFFTALFAEDDFKVSWPCEVHKVLGVTAPELVLLAVVKYSPATICAAVPFTSEFLFNSVRQLH